MKNKKSTKVKLFRQFSAVTIIAVYLLILVGGIVRSTGAGMGCPDWPKCFGNWVPPTEVSELPANYKDLYAQQRAEKNEKFVRYLIALGFEELAYEIKNDSSILIEADFNAAKTWTEYINRLLGASIGILIFGTFVLSVSYWAEDKPLVVLSFLAFVLVGFEGWIGSIVVSTNLLQWMITVHMLLAILIVCLLIYVYERAKRAKKVKVESAERILWVISLCIVGSLVQIVLGTQVREAIDLVSERLARSEWIASLGIGFKIHRSYSLFLLAIHACLAWLLYKNRKQSSVLRMTALFLMAVVAVEVLSGVLMAYFGVPAFIQPLHLLLGTLAIGVQYYLWLMVKNGKRKLSIAE